MQGPAIARRPLLRLPLTLALALASLTSLCAQAQTPAAQGWAQCRALDADQARLQCFDRWAAQQHAPGQLPTEARQPQGNAAWASRTPGSMAPAHTPAGADMATQAVDRPTASEGIGLSEPCSNPRRSPMSRFWELAPETDCGTFGIRGYRPLSLSWIGSDSINTTPGSPAADHTATAPTPYRTTETRIQLSVRTKIARGMLTDGDSPLRDSLWFGYTQQSYWQLFNAGISRPFRSTDHEPELVYIHPLDMSLDGGWRLRYGGLSLNHQSNGQSLPLSRSWNRIILMAGLEKDDRFLLQARAWARVPEKADKDDNPDIADLVGRAEVSAFWNLNKTNTLGVTVRHALRSSARGSVRLEWLRAIGASRADGEPGGLRLHTQLFSGYGDSLLDYNRRRTVLSVGLSLIDF